MFDPQKLLDQFLGAKNPDGSRQGMSPEMMKTLAGGAAATGLAAILLGTKPGKKLAGTAVRLGGAAALAGLAYKVWNDWQASKEAPPGEPSPREPMKDVTPKPEGTPFLPTQPEARANLSLGLLRAMIAAAKADGHIDDSEQRNIFGKLEQMNLDSEARAFVMEELKKPLDIDAVVAAATSPEVAVEIYAASFLAIDPDDPAEQAYLAMLASRLKLDPGLRAAVETEARKVVA
jgi:uncharacterized membrane protein YebE (DUF533 family)